MVIERVPSKGHYVFLMHCNTPPFDNNDLRMALKLAIDREALLSRSCKATARSATTSRSPPLTRYYPTDIPQRVYDPEEAASFYKKSGHSGPILLRTSEVAFAGAVDAAVLYQQQAAKAGIQIEVQREPADGYWDQVWNKQPFCASYWGGRPTQDGMYSTAYYSKADWNDTRFFREDFDKLLIEARGYAGRRQARRSLPADGDDGARRGRTDPADVQRLHRRARREGHGLGRRRRTTRPRT